MSRSIRTALVALAPLVLGGCLIGELLMLPFKLLFGAVDAIGSGIGGLVASNVTAEPIEGPPPTVTPMPDGRWMVEAPSEPARFRVTVSAEGREPRTFTWPDDFRGVAADAHGVARVDCELAPVAAR